MLEAVIAATHAARGNIQLLDASTQRLQIVSQRGLKRAFIDFFNTQETITAACRTAMARHARVIVEDVRTSSEFSEDARRVVLDSGGLACQATPLTSRSGDVIGIVSTLFEVPHRCSDEQLRLVDLFARHAADFIDYSRTKRALEDVCAREREARAHADAANSSKDQFLATLAHELRQPLSAIVPALEVRKRSLSAERRQRAAEIIDEQVRHLTKLVEDLSDASKISRGTMSLRRERVDLCAVVQRELDTDAPRFAARGQQLSVDLPDEPLWILADPMRLKQVFSNLLLNAGSYTPCDGHIRVVLHADGESAIFHLADDGEGIPAEALERIFQPFERGQPDGSSPSIGIGLALVRQLVELHGGTVIASSDGPGRGSEFVVRLPLLIPAPA